MSISSMGDTSAAASPGESCTTISQYAQGRFDDIEQRLQRDPGDQSAKGDLKALEDFVNLARESQERAGRFGDPQELSRLNKLWEDIMDLGW